MRNVLHTFLATAISLALTGIALPASDASRDELVRPAGRWLTWTPWRSDQPAREPVAAIRSNSMAIAWTALDAEGRSRVFLAEGRGRLPVVGAAAPFADIPVGEEHSPAIAYAGGGDRLGVVWVNSSPDRAILFFSETTAKADEPAAGAFAISATGDAAIEAPVISWLDASTPIVAWTETTGSTSAVFAGWRFGDEWQVRRASIGDHPFDLGPSFLSEPSPALWYYSFDESEVAFRATQTGLWGLAREGASVAHPAPAGRFPILFDTAGAPVPGAAWLEPVQGEEVLLLFDPSRPVEDSIRVEAGSAGSRVIDPAADEGALAWIEERDGFRRMHVTTPDGARESIPVGIAARQLRVAADGGVVLAVWVEEPKDGGTGALRAAVRRNRSQAP